MDTKQGFISAIASTNYDMLIDAGIDGDYLDIIDTLNSSKTTARS